ncbi:MAG: hypothetical protein L0Y71_22180 [Gemmataceae bacterium]|nr:hypothetical protein [Gemmataceae bacterium]
MHEQLIRSLRRQIATVLILKHALLWLAAGAFLWGTFVIVWRVATGGAADELWWGLAAAPAIGLASAWLALRQVPSKVRLRAVVDSASRCGGLLMAADETRLGGWRQTMPDPARLHVQWRGGQSWLTFLAGVAFLLVALLFPQSLMTLAGEPPLDITDEAQLVAAQLDILKEEKVLEPQRAEFLKERLQQLKDDASGKNPVKTLEALDHLRDIANQAAKEAAESAIDKTEKLGKAEGLADGIQKNDGELDPRVEQEALKTLASLVKEAAKETSLAEKLSPELLKQLQAGKFGEEQLKQLAAALKGSKRDLSKMLEKLNAAKLIDAELLKKLAEAGECMDCSATLKCKPCKCMEATKKCDCPDAAAIAKGAAPATKCKCCEASGVCNCDKFCPKKVLAQCLG